MGRRLVGARKALGSATLAAPASPVTGGAAPPSPPAGIVPVTGVGKPLCPMHDQDGSLTSLVGATSSLSGGSPLRDAVTVAPTNSTRRSANGNAAGDESAVGGSATASGSLRTQDPGTPAFLADGVEDPWVVTGNHAFTHTLQGLLPYTAYRVRVRVHTMVGWSPFSEPVVVNTAGKSSLKTSLTELPKGCDCEPIRARQLAKANTIVPPVPSPRVTHVPHMQDGWWPCMQRTSRGHPLTSTS